VSEQLFLFENEHDFEQRILFKNPELLSNVFKSIKEKLEISNMTIPLSMEDMDLDRIAFVLETIPDIFEIEYKYFELFNDIKSMINQGNSLYSEKNLQLEQIKNIITAHFIFHSFYKNDKITFDQTQINLQKSFFELEENTNRTLHQYESSIKTLCQIELHKELQKEDKTHLIDIYFNIDKMNQWKSKCLEFRNSVKMKLNSFLDKKTKKEDFSGFMNVIKEFQIELKKIQFEFDQILKNIETKISGYILEYFYFYIDMRSEIKKICDPFTEPNKVIQYMSNIEVIKEKYRYFLNEFTRSKEYFTKLLNFNITFNLRQNQIKLKEYIRKFFDWKRTSIKTDIDLSQMIISDFKKIKNDFEFLQKPEHVPEAYRQLLTEIEQRHHTFESIFSLIKNLENIRKDENQRRKQFLLTYGKILSEKVLHVFPYLKHNFDISVTYDKYEFKSLPNIKEKEGDKIEQENQGSTLFEKIYKGKFKSDSHILSVVKSNQSDFHKHFLNKNCVGCKLDENWHNTLKKQIKIFILDNTECITTRQLISPIDINLKK
jgi:hypothetical protein